MYLCIFAVQEIKDTIQVNCYMNCYMVTPCQQLNSDRGKGYIGNERYVNMFPLQAEMDVF